MNLVLCELVDIDECWDEKVKLFYHDIYHLSGWLKASEIIDKGFSKGLVITINNKYILIPLLCRDLNDGWWDAQSVYGYSSPLVDSNLSESQILYAFNQAICFLKQKRCVSWFMRLHPICNEKLDLNLGHTVEHGRTLSIDLTKTAEEHWVETQNRHRRGINKAIKMGISTSIELLNVHNIHIFKKVYNETMRHLAASDFYFFCDRYYYKLAENLPNNLLLINAYDEDVVIASSLYTVCDNSLIMQFHLGGTLNEYRDLQPSKLITHVARDWGRENNYKILHLGGGVGGEKDSLYEYKKGFSSTEHCFKTLRLILNDEIYMQLCLKQGYKIEEIEDTSKFFPLYRKVN